MTVLANKAKEAEGHDEKHLVMSEALNLNAAGRPTKFKIATKSTSFTGHTIA